MSVGIADEIGIERWIVRNHDDVVLGDGHVGLDRRHADLQRAAKRRQRIFRREPARATVAFEVEGEGRSGHERQQKRRQRVATDLANPGHRFAQRGLRLHVESHKHHRLSLHKVIQVAFLPALLVSTTYYSTRHMNPATKQNHSLKAEFCM